MNIRVAHVAPISTAEPSAGPGGVSDYMVSLIRVLGESVESLVLCNVDADVQAAVRSMPDTRFIRTWRFGDVRYPARILAALRANVHDVVHIQHELFMYGAGARALCFPVLLFLLRSRTNVVVTVHGVVTRGELDESLMRGRRSLVPFQLIQHVVIAVFRAIARSRAHKIVHSEELKRRLILLGASERSVTAIAHPLASVGAARESRREARSRLGLPADAPVIITWGFWNSYKGHALLVEGFKTFRETHPGARLLLGAGPHPQLQADTTYANEYSEAMNAYRNVVGVEVLGFIDAGLLPAYVRAADVSVFAYTKYIAASGPLAFSVSVGTPVLLSSVFDDAPRELKFEPNPPALAAKLDAFFQEPERFERATAEIADAASSEVIRVQYLDVYRKLASTTRRES